LRLSLGKAKATIKGQRIPIPALPFCHFAIKAEKPKSSAYPTVLNTLGDRLRARRLDLGLHQKDVAAIVGVTVDTVCYWENNRVEPSPTCAREIVEFLGHDPTK